MEDINFELAEKLGYKRPKSLFEKNIDSLRKVSEGIKKEELINFIAGFVNQYEKTYLIYPDGNIEQYSADYKIAKSNSNTVENKIAYYYISGINLYFVCAVDYLNILQIDSVRPNKDQKAKIIIPNNYLNDKQENYYRIDAFGNTIVDESLDAINRFSLGKNINSNSKFYVEGNPFSNWGNSHTVQEYSVYDKPALLIRIPYEIKVYLKNGRYISHEFRNTLRNYTNPDLFAGYIGVLFEMLNYKLTCTGSCFKDGSGYPSVSHINGKAFDMEKKSTDPTVELTTNEINLVKAFNNFHFQILYTNKTCYNQLKDLINGMKISVVNGHDDHLHFGNFNSDKIIRRKKIFVNDPKPQLMRV